MRSVDRIAGDEALGPERARAGAGPTPAGARRRGRASTRSRRPSSEPREGRRQAPLGRRFEDGQGQPPGRTAARHPAARAEGDRRRPATNASGAMPSSARAPSAPGRDRPSPSRPRPAGVGVGRRDGAWPPAARPRSARAAAPASDEQQVGAGLADPREPGSLVHADRDARCRRRPRGRSIRCRRPAPRPLPPASRACPRPRPRAQPAVPIEDR